jgi:SAM-dependent methyltransferase
MIPPTTTSRRRTIAAPEVGRWASVKLAFGIEIVKIQPPPFMLPGSNICFISSDDIEYLCSFVNYFNDKDFDERYFTQLEWFKEDIFGIERLLNFGCGWGRETFALSWKIKPTESVGIDINSSNIEFAKSMAKFRERFLTSILPSVRKPIANKFLQDWFEGLPIEIWMGIPPQFIQDNITTFGVKPENPFSLVYCRCTLWKMLDNDKNCMSSVSRNINKMLKPRVGRLVIVEPSKKGSVDYGFEKYFQETGFILDRVEEKESRLGWLEPFGLGNEQKDIKGYIFSKK